MAAPKTANVHLSNFSHRLTWLVQVDVDQGNLLTADWRLLTLEDSAVETSADTDPCNVVSLRKFLRLPHLQQNSAGARLAKHNAGAMTLFKRVGCQAWLIVLALFLSFSELPCSLKFARVYQT